MAVAVIPQSFLNTATAVSFKKKIHATAWARCEIAQNEAQAR